MSDIEQAKKNVVEPISFVIYGNPVPQQRHRDGRQVVRTKKGKLIRSKYDPSFKLKEDFLKEAAKHAPEKAWTGPLGMPLIFAFPIPKSRKDIKPGDHHFIKPDRDNLEKFVKDALAGSKKKRNGIKPIPLFFEDDCQICDGQVAKVYAEPGFVGTHITIWRIPNG